MNSGEWNETTETNTIRYFKWHCYMMCYSFFEQYVSSEAHGVKSWPHWGQWDFCHWPHWGQDFIIQCKWTYCCVCYGHPKWIKMVIIWLAVVVRKILLGSISYFLFSVLHLNGEKLYFLSREDVVLFQKHHCIYNHLFILFIFLLFVSSQTHIIFILLAAIFWSAIPEALVFLPLIGRALVYCVHPRAIQVSFNYTLKMCSS